MINRAARCYVLMWLPHTSTVHSQCMSNPQRRCCTTADRICADNFLAPLQLLLTLPLLCWCFYTAAAKPSHAYASTLQCAFRRGHHSWHTTTADLLLLTHPCCLHIEVPSSLLRPQHASETPCSPGTTLTKPLAMLAVSALTLRHVSAMCDCHAGE
jgi:hypothetical protein